MHWGEELRNQGLCRFGVCYLRTMMLKVYITALIEDLHECDPDAYVRMCHVVGKRSARIQLDEEAVIVRMNLGMLQVESSTGEADVVSGEGKTTRATVLALLDGSLEVSEAILNDSIAVYGELEQINRMFQAIEIILDASPRCPELQRLSQKFVQEASANANALSFENSTWYPFAVLPQEMQLLARYDLLPRETK